MTAFVVCHSAFHGYSERRKVEWTISTDIPLTRYLAKRYFATLSDLNGYELSDTLVTDHGAKLFFTQ